MLPPDRRLPVGQRPRQRLTRAAKHGAPPRGRPPPTSTRARPASGVGDPARRTPRRAVARRRRVRGGAGGRCASGQPRAISITAPEPRAHSGGAGVIESANVGNSASAQATPRARRGGAGGRAGTADPGPRTSSAGGGGGAAFADARTAASRIRTCENARPPPPRAREP